MTADLASKIVTVNYDPAQVSPTEIAEAIDAAVADIAGAMGTGGGIDRDKGARQHGDGARVGRGIPDGRGE